MTQICAWLAERSTSASSALARENVYFFLIFRKNVTRKGCYVDYVALTNISSVINTAKEQNSRFRSANLSACETFTTSV